MGQETQWKWQKRWKSMNGQGQIQESRKGGNWVECMTINLYTSQGGLGVCPPWALGPRSFVAFSCLEIASGAV